MSNLRSTKHLIKLLSRTNWSHDLPIFYTGIRRVGISAARITSSQFSLKRSALTGSVNYIQRNYGSDSNFPSHKKVPLPALSPTMERGTIVSWEKKEGDRLNEGDLLAEIETDKATMGFETPEEGYLARIMIPSGTKEVPIGKVVCIIVENEEDIAAFKDYTVSEDSETLNVAPVRPTLSKEPKTSAKAPAPSVPTPSKPAISTPAPSKPSPTPIASSPGARVFASPLARKTAKEKGIDISAVRQGSGPEGRIRVEDVLNFKGEAAGSTVATSAAFVNVPLTVTKQENYQQLLEWKKKVPQYYLTVEVKMDNTIKLKNELNSSLAKDTEKLTETDFIVKASALACQKIPEVNSSWQDTHIRRYNNVNINIIYDSDNSVYAPVLNFAERKGLASINKELNQLKAKVFDGTLQSHELQGGTFTIVNLGMYKVKHFSQIINYPQACSLSIGSVRAQFIPNESTPENNRAVANIMCATLSCDHRVVDGAVGAQWLDAFKKLLEKPQLMLM